MKEERNQIKINNPDGFDRTGYGEGRRTFFNDSSKFVREHSLSDVGETAKAKEHFGAAEPKTKGRRGFSEGGPKGSSGANPPSGGATPPQGGGDSPAGNLTSQVVSQTNATVTNSVAAAVGGGVTALAGVVAATVVTAVIVVTTFLAVLGVNLSLVMADYTSLTFRLELVTEGEGELEDPYYQAIISGNGVSESLTVMAGELFTFSGLQPDKEYLITIKNGEGEVQVEQSFCTAAKPVEKGTMTVLISDAEVSIFVQGVPLKSGEFYTVTAKNEKGDTLFVADEVAKEKTFTFRLNSPARVSVTLSVGGKAQAVEEFEWGGEPAPEPEPEPEPLPPDYDLDNGAWSWTGTTQAKIVFPDKNGGDALTVAATVADSETPATCETDGSVVHIATATYDGRTFTDRKTEVLTAFGHDYVFEGFVWTPVYPSDDDVNISDGHGYVGAGSDGPIISDEPTSSDDEYMPIIGYTAVARFVCSHDANHVLMTAEGVTLTYTDSAGACEENVVRTYVASLSYQGNAYTDSKQLVLDDTALGHDYVFDCFVWTPVYSSDAGNVASGPSTLMGYTAVARFVCSRDSEHVLTISEDVEVTYVDTPAECEEDAYRTFTASVTYDGVTYTNDRVQVFEETAHGHDFSEASETFDWGTGENDEVTASLCFYCSYGCGEFISEDAEVNMEAEDPAALCELGGNVTYFATILYRDTFYEDEKEVENVVLGHDYGEPVFEWTSPDGGTNYYATAYFVCSRCLDHTATVQSDMALSQTFSDCRVYKYVTITFNGQSYYPVKTVYFDRTTGYAPAVGVNYKIGDRISSMDNDTYFKMGSGEYDEVILVDYYNTTVTLRLDAIVSDGDYTIYLTDYPSGTAAQSLYLWENGARGENVAGWNVTFEEAYGTPVGITIVSGSGTAADPFVLAPLYGNTVTFDYGNGVIKILPFTEDEVENGARAVAPKEDPKKSGYIFNGWMLDGEPYNFYEDVTEDLILVPAWVQVAETVSVYFMVDGEPYEVQEIVRGSCAATPISPEREGVTAVGWYVDDETVMFDFNTVIEEDTFLYVKWEPSA